MGIFISTVYSSTVCIIKKCLAKIQILFKGSALGFVSFCFQIFGFLQILM